MTDFSELFRNKPLQAVSFLIAIGFLFLPFFRPETPPYLLLLIGRFHPMVLHFPLVLIMLALIFELGRYFKLIRHGEDISFLLLIGASITTFVAALAGSFLFASGNYSGELIEQHFWAGAITGCLIFMALGFFLLDQNRSQFYWIYMIFLGCSNISAAAAGHIGGSVTHGSDYLTEYIPLIFGRHDQPTQQKPTEEMLLYEDMLAPIFETKCMSCHNAARAKGGYIMTSLSRIMAGGDSGQLPIDTLKPDSSELYKRVILPEEDGDRMPPEGNSPLSYHEIALLKYWIDIGAKTDLKVADTQSDRALNATINSLIPELARYQRRIILSEVKKEVLRDEINELSESLKVAIYSDSIADDDGLYILAMKFPPAPFSNNQFRELAPYFNVFSKASLISSGINDDGLYHVSKMTNLKALYLQKTKLDGQGLIYLQSLKKLEILNLSFTQIDDKYALELLEIPSLKEVYLFQTEVTDQVVEAIRKNRPKLKVYLEEGPYL